MVQSERSVEELWLEWIMARLTTTGDGPRFLPEVAAVPEWFRLCELGLGQMQGPTVFWTTQNLQRINRKNRRLFARGERKARGDEDQATAERRRTKWRVMLKVAEAARAAEAA